MRLPTAILLSVLLGGCATAYQPLATTGGFYDQAVNDSTYVVGFRGNGNTDMQRANDFARLRAAEVGAQLGYSHFTIENVQDLGIVITPQEVRYSNSMTGSFDGNHTKLVNGLPVYKPRVEFGVRYFAGVPKEDRAEYFVVQDVIRELKAKYKIVR